MKTADQTSASPYSFAVFFHYDTGFHLTDLELIFKRSRDHFHFPYCTRTSGGASGDGRGRQTSKNCFKVCAAETKTWKMRRRQISQAGKWSKIDLAEKYKKWGQDSSGRKIHFRFHSPVHCCCHWKWKDWPSECCSTSPPSLSLWSSSS